MTTADLETALKTLTPHVYHLAAPAGKTEYIAWHRYGSAALIGDDGVRLHVPKVQLDIIWQAKSDAFPDQIKELLSSLSLPWFEAYYGYDDEWSGMRCILQVEVA